MLVYLHRFPPRASFLQTINRIVAKRQSNKWAWNIQWYRFLSSFLPVTHFVWRCVWHGVWVEIDRILSFLRQSFAACTDGFGAKSKSKWPSLWGNCQRRMSTAAGNFWVKTMSFARWMHNLCVFAGWMESPRWEFSIWSEFQWKKAKKAPNSFDTLLYNPRSPRFE